MKISMTFRSCMKRPVRRWGSYFPLPPAAEFYYHISHVPRRKFSWPIDAETSTTAKSKVATNISVADIRGGVAQSAIPTKENAECNDVKTVKETDDKECSKPSAKNQTKLQNQTKPNSKPQSAQSAIPTKENKTESNDVKTVKETDEKECSKPSAKNQTKLQNQTKPNSKPQSAQSAIPTKENKTESNDVKTVKETDEKECSKPSAKNLRTLNSNQGANRRSPKMKNYPTQRNNHHCNRPPMSQHNTSNPQTPGVASTATSTEQKNYDNPKSSPRKAFVSTASGRDGGHKKTRSSRNNSKPQSAPAVCSQNKNDGLKCGKVSGGKEVLGINAVAPGHGFHNPHTATQEYDRSPQRPATTSFESNAITVPTTATIDSKREVNAETQNTIASTAENSENRDPEKKLVESDPQADLRESLLISTLDGKTLHVNILYLRSLKQSNKFTSIQSFLVYLGNNDSFSVNDCWVGLK